MNRLFAAVAAFAGVLCAQTPIPGSASTGTISGLVTGPTGKPVIGAPVWAIRTFSVTPTKSPIMATLPTDVNGRYYFPSLVAGSYRICVTADGAALLDPCSWSANPPIWNLRAGQNAEIDVAMTRGVFLHLRFDDPKASAVALQQSTGAPPIRVRARSGSGRAITFFEIAKDANGRNFRALLPFGETAQLSIDSALVIVDQTGKPTAGVAVSIPATLNAAGTVTSGVQVTDPAQTSASPPTPGGSSPTALQQYQTIRFTVQ